MPVITIPASALRDPLNSERTLTAIEDADRDDDAACFCDPLRPGNPWDENPEAFGEVVRLAAC